MWAVFAGLLLLFLFSAMAIAANPIQLENAKTGTTRWKISNLSSTQSDIEGYASATSVNRGGTINLYVSTTSPSYTIEVFRIGWYGGAGGRQVFGPVTQVGIAQPMPVPDANGLRECNWTSPYPLAIPYTAGDPTNWASGVYVAKLTASANGAQNYIVFTVRDDSRAPAADLLFQSGVNTWQAYNNWGGQSLYASNSDATTPARSVSFNRPYTVDGAGDFFEWEVNMVRFLEREGYDVTYATDVDLHEQGFALIAPHKALLSVGHDEYWSYQMKSAVHQARDQGRHIGFFGANPMYWQIRYAPSTLPFAAPDRTLLAYKEASLVSDPYWLDGDPTNNKFVTTQYRNFVVPPYNLADPVAQPENGIVGVMYQGSPFNGDIVVSDASNWIYAGTGVTNGYHFVGLLGYEADAMFDNGYAPPGLQKVAESPDTWGNSHMATYTAASGSVVFATGSMQWVWGLDDYGVPYRGPSRLDPAAQQTTRNILNRFAPGPRAPDAPTIGTAIAGNAQASVAFAAPANDGGSAITGYTVASNPGGGIDSNAGSTALSHVVTGLTNGTAYTFTVTAVNAAGSSAPSSPSNSVTPTVPLTTLSNGVPVTNISGAFGSMTMFQLAVPAGASNLSFVTSGGSGGDVDIFLRFNALPTVTVFDAKSDGPTRNETITIAAPQAGTYYLLLYGDWSTYTGVTLVASYSTGTASAPGSPTGASATAGNGQATVTFNAPASNGGSTITGYTVASNPGGGIDSNAGSTALSHVVTGLANGTAYTFTVTATNAAGSSAPSSPSNSVTPVASSTTTLSNGVAVTNISGVQGSSNLYQISVPAGATNLSFVTSGGSGGDVDIFARFNAIPTVTAFDAKSDGPTRNETITIAAPQAGTYYLLLYGDWSTYAGVTLVASYNTGTASAPGSPTGASATAGNGQATVTFNAPANNGGSAITGYTVASNPGGGVDSNAGSTALSHVVTGLANGTAYTFTVTATNAAGSSAPSSPSNSVTPVANGAAALSNGMTVTNISGVQGSSNLYQISVPAGASNLSFVTSGGSGGDVDIFARFNAIPTVTVFDAKSDGPTRNETITIAAPQAGTYYLLLYGDWSTYTGVTLVVSYSTAQAGVPGSPTGASATAGNGQATVTFNAPASNGGSAITGYTVASNPGGGVDSNAGSTALSHVVTGLANGTAYTFTVTAANAAGSSAPSSPSNSVTPTAPVTTLTKGVAVTNISGAFGSMTMFQLAVPAGASNLSFATSGGSGGDVDIFLRFNALPTVTVFDAKSDGPTRNETITIAAPQAGTYYLLLYGDWSTYAGVTLVASYSP